MQKLNALQKFPKVFIIPFCILLWVAILGPNQIVAGYACAVLAAGLIILWRTNEPPILPFIFLYQWLQASVTAFYGNIIGEPITFFVGYPGLPEKAAILTLTGLVVLAIAIRLAAGRGNPDLGSRLYSFIASTPHRIWVQAYLIAWAFSALCAFLAPVSAGLTQPLLILAELKWAAFLLLSASTFGLRGRTRLPWIAVFLIELGLGFGGFFADFGAVFIYSLIGIAFVGHDFIRRNIIQLGFVSVLMLFVAVAWTAVKTDYREYLNAGSREQVVLVGYSDRMSDLFDRVAALDGPAMIDGADTFVRRLTYIEFFGVVLKRDQLGQAHTGGEIWGYAALSPVMPRALFPDKAIVNDTKLTTRYTGIDPASWKTGVSVSLGYMAEAFIDFGIIFMFAAIAALGMLLGWIYRWLVNQQGSRLIIGLSLAPVALMPAHLLEISIIKLLPALILSVLACWLTLNLLGPQLLRSLGLRPRRPAAI